MAAELEWKIVTDCSQVWHGLQKRQQAAPGWEKISEGSPESLVEAWRMVPDPDRRSILDHVCFLSTSTEPFHHGVPHLGPFMWQRKVPREGSIHQRSSKPRRR